MSLVQTQSLRLEGLPRAKRDACILDDFYHRARWEVAQKTIVHSGGLVYCASQLKVTLIRARLKWAARKHVHHKRRR